MSAIKKSPNIAVLFGILAITTSALLLFDPPEWIKILFAVFWFITGLLGLYTAIKFLS